jgi:hydroxypyruvate isomerase
MPAYVANTSFLFAERPSLDRFAAAAAAGFRAVECHYPSDIPAARTRPRPFRRPGCINTRNRMGDQRDNGLAAVPAAAARPASRGRRPSAAGPIFWRRSLILPAIAVC